MMNRFLVKLSLMLTAVLTVTGLVSCSEDKEEPHTPSVNVTQILAGTTLADVTYTVTDADHAVYKVIKQGEAVPTVDELLADATAKSLSVTSTKMTIEGLTQDTKYTLVAAAAYGDKFKSQLVTMNFTTTFNKKNLTFKSASGSFVHRDEATNTALYVIKFSTNDLNDETTMPMSNLYVTLTGKNENIDLRKLKIPTGTFTVGDLENPKDGNFYPGTMNENKEAGNTFVASLKTAADKVETDLVKDGTITITELENSQYEVGVNFVYEDGTHLEATYKGSLVVDNNSGEIPEASLLPLPESSMEGDMTVTFNSRKQYGMVTNYGNARFGIRNRKELFFSLYTDDSYAECVDMYLLINTDKYSEALPVGKYPVIPEINWKNITGNDLCAEPAWRVADANGRQVDLGTWYTWGGFGSTQKKAPFTGGEIEVVKSDEKLKDVEIKFSLKDAKGHTLTGVYKGALDVNQ